MTRKYANPPVIEAICEFRLPPEVKWDLTIPGLIYEKVSKNGFPNKEQRLVQEIEIVQNTQGIQQQIQTSERVLFLNNDRKMFVQAGAHLLAVNCLKPYPHWENYKPHIETAFNALTDILPIQTFKKVSLRYINRIEIPGQSVNLDDHFEFRPHLGEKLPEDMANFIVGCLLPYRDKQDACKITLTNSVSEKPENLAFLLELDYSLMQPHLLAASDALDWAEQAHIKVNEAFEGCITDKLRAIFQEVK